MNVLGIAKQSGLILLLSFLLGGCPSADNGVPDSFDRKAMLSDLASKLIVPSYSALNSTLDKLQNAVDQFTLAPSKESLDNVRDIWKASALQWQDVVSFDFGPAETLYGNLSVNAATFPADSAGIEAFVTASDTTLQNYERDTRGLYGIEYMLFAFSDSTTVQQFAGNMGKLRGAYLRSITRKLNADVKQVYQAWVSGFEADFISRNGTDAGSGTSQLFNAMNIGYELIKNYKLGIPLGLRAGQSNVEPNKVEALYSGLSMSLIDRHYHAVMRVWEGRSFEGAKILGFKDYLQVVPNGPQLVTETDKQAAAVEAALLAVPTSSALSNQIVSNPQPAIALHTEMQKLTRFLKSELSSLTGLAITYASGDGD